MRIKIGLIAIVAFVVSFSAYALPPGEPPPEPPPKINDCSPGFWKNHQDWWVGAGLFCADGGCASIVLTELQSKGKDSGDRRHVAADALNTWADGYYKYLICTD